MYDQKTKQRFNGGEGELGGLSIWQLQVTSSCGQLRVTSVRVKSPKGTTQMTK
jgi:hypothetical protein